MTPALARAEPAPAEAPGAWLSHGERHPPHLRNDSSLVAAVDAFQSNPELRLMPVLDAKDRPIGALFEKDIRRLLLNPYGHALLRNPAYGSSITAQVRPCPFAEVTLPVAELIDAWRAGNGSEGMILTHGGRLFGVVTNRRLVHLAAERELSAAHARVERAQRIEEASEAFERQVRALTRTMGELSALVDSNAAATADRAALAGERATAVATAAEQTTHNIGEIAMRGRELAGALGEIGANTLEAKAAAAEAVALVGTGSARARELLRSAQSIESVIGMISEIARQVNLLALNATIEAARAGEAGRGFTVVAQEVKQLSTQTGTAAATITAHVREICQSIEAVAEGHGEIERAMTAIASLSTAIEAAVRTQEVATRTIAHNVGEAVDASTGIQHDVEAIGGTSRGASSSAHEMRTLAQRLQGDAGLLSEQVGAFLDVMRTA